MDGILVSAQRAVVTVTLAMICAGGFVLPERAEAMQNSTTAAEVRLSTLRLSTGEVSPGFGPGRFEYVVRVAHSEASLSITAETASPGLALRVNGHDAASGQPSRPVALPVGRSFVRVEVIGADPAAKATYTIKVLRDAPTPTWERVRETSPWLPRDSAGELVFRDRMWLFGGYTPGLVSDVWSSPDGNQWTQTGTIPDEAGVNIPVNLVFNERMWIVTNDGKLWSSADGVAWTLVTDAVPWGKRYGAGGVVYGGRMWVMGGMRSGRPMNDVWSSADGAHWTLETEHAAWSPRQLFSMLTVHGGRMWIAGGGITVYHPFKAYDDVWSSADGRNWAKVLDDAPWPARIWSTVAVYRNRLWIIGGFRSEPTWNNFADAWYSADGATWRELDAPERWSPRHELSAYVFADRLWVAAGNAWPLMNDVWSLHIAGLCFVTQPVIEDFVATEYVYRARADFNKSAGKLRYRLVEAPKWLRVDARTGVVRGTAPAPGDFSVTVEARDAAEESARQSYTLHVLALP